MFHRLRSNFDQEIYSSEPCLCEAMSGAGMPQPGALGQKPDVVATPPQAGTLKVFLPGVRHTTRENIRNFFDKERYAQKRPLTSPTSAPAPAAKARLDRHELLEKFKLAAALNGYSMEDLFVLCRRVVFKYPICKRNAPCVLFLFGL